MKTKTTKRKFYNKWLYKVTLRYGTAIPYRTLPTDIKVFLDQVDPTIWRKRIESNAIDIYTNDQLFYNELSLRFSDKVFHRFEPNLDTLPLLENLDNLIVSHLPYDRYQYRVYLKPHNYAYQVENKLKFVNWIESQFPKIHISSAVTRWFLSTNWNWDRRYILVEDNNSLLLLKMKYPDIIGRVYNLVIADK